jgi:hypothetical protein
MENGYEISEPRCHTPSCESYRIARNFVWGKELIYPKIRGIRSGIWSGIMSQKNGYLNYTAAKT